jgi:multidrug efflux pump subunit AcrB
VRRVAIFASAQGRPAGDVGKDVNEIIKQTTLPPGYRFSIRGQQEQMQDSFASAMAALGLAVIFIYLILASQFASFLQPAAIMVSLPFSLIGVFLALMFTGTTLNIFSMIGFIMLMGLVTKNAILLVDFANRARRAGASLHDAMLQAGQVRLRADPHDDGRHDRRHAAAGRSASAREASSRRRWAARSSAASSRRRC